MAVDWSKPIRRVDNKEAVKYLGPSGWYYAIGIDGGTYYYSSANDGISDGQPALENYEPEVENKPMTVDWTKPIQTRDGRPARVLCLDLRKGAGDFAAVAVTDTDHTEFIWTRPLTGKAGDGESGIDIINVPEKRTVYINFYEGGCPEVCRSRAAADVEASKYSRLNRIACIKVEYTEGQFDI